MSKFRVGDIVRTKKYYGVCFFNPDMREYEGELARIVKQNANGSFKLDIDGCCWNWTPAMLVPYRKLVSTQLEVREVNPPSLEALEKYIIETTRAIFEADEERDQPEVFELEFITSLLTACCKHKLIRLSREEDDDNGDC